MARPLLMFAPSAAVVLAVSVNQSSAPPRRSCPRSDRWILARIKLALTACRRVMRGCIDWAPRSGEISTPMLSTKPAVRVTKKVRATAEKPPNFALRADPWPESRRGEVTGIGGSPTPLRISHLPRLCLGCVSLGAAEPCSLEGVPCPTPRTITDAGGGNVSSHRHLSFGCVWQNCYHRQQARNMAL